MYVFLFTIYIKLIILLDEKINDIPEIKCVAIAPPACFASSKEEFTSHVSSIVLSDDLVPRLSYVSVKSLLTIASKIAEEVAGIAELLAGIFMPEALQRLIRAILPKTKKLQLLPAASIYHLTNVDNDVCTPRILATSPSFFRCLILTENSLNHHRLDMYRFYLASVISETQICLLFGNSNQE